MIDFIFLIYIVFAIITLILYLPRLNGFRYGFKKIPRRQAKDKRRIAVLVPARNESTTISDLFSSISEQDYDRAYFDVFVIVKEQNDPTIELAKKYGFEATVVPEQTCKGDALDGFFKSHSKEKLALYEAFVIVDADGVLSNSYISELNNALEDDAEIFVTGKRAKNFLKGRESRSLFSNCAALTYPMVDNLGNTYRAKKKMPLNLCGQGLMLRRRVIEDLGGWPLRTMTEDYELKLISILRGYKSTYYPYATLYTEEAISHKENFERRVRWLIGYKQCDKKYKKDIKAQVKRKKRINRGEIEYFYGLFPYFFFMVGTALTVISGIALAVYYAVSKNILWISSLIWLTALPLAVLYFLLHVFSIMAILTEYENYSSITKRERFAVVLYNPFYMLEYVCVYLTALIRIVRKQAPVWQQTKRLPPKKGKKREKRQLIEGVQNTLESYGKFDRETISYGNNWKMPNEKYRYNQAWYDKIITGFWRTFLAVFGPILIKVAFRARVVGKENLKALGKTGFITICNHVHVIDTLFVRQAIGHYNSYHTMAPFNNKCGIGGHIIRHGGTLPFSSNITAMRNLDAEINYQLSRGKRVNFYPEHALWWGYQKPRPMKKGAFCYAAKFDVPVLPIFCTFDKTKRGGITNLQIHILPAVYADKSLCMREQIQAMKKEAEAQWQACYEEYYKKPLVYLSEENK